MIQTATGCVPILVLGACMGLCLPTCLVGVAISSAFCFPSELLEGTALPGDIVPGGGSCWTSHSRRELGYLCRGAGDHGSLVQMVLFGGLFRARG